MRVKPSNTKKLRTGARHLRRTLGFNAELVSAGVAKKRNDVRADMIFAKDL
jgi:hypothetical protein